MRKNSIILSCTLSACILIFSACSGNKTKMMVGKWSLADLIKDGKSYKRKQLDSATTQELRRNISKVTMTFNADSTFNEGDSNGDKKPNKKRYKLSADAKKILFTNLDTKDTLAVQLIRLSNDTLQFMFPVMAPSDPKTSLVFYKNKNK